MREEKRGEGGKKEGRKQSEEHIKRKRGRNRNIRGMREEGKEEGKKEMRGGKVSRKRNYKKKGGRSRGWREVRKKR